MAHRRLTPVRLLLAVLAGLLVAGACTGGADRSDRSGGRRGGPSTSTAPAGEKNGDGRAEEQAGPLPAPGRHRRGGSVRVGVWALPDVAAPTLGGAAVRALVLPQLFVAGPDGRWLASLVEPGSDRTSPGAQAASFRLREGAVWSNGTPIGIDDLRRSADARFVAGLDGPAPDGTITVRFTHPLPGWRRLWSVVDSVAAPAPGVWGGPFMVASAVAGLETVLGRNPRWYGGVPLLDEVRLVVVPDSTTARQLLGRGELDVVMPPAYTVRSRQLAAVAGVRVESAMRGGWWVGLSLNPDRLDEGVRRGLAASLDRRLFVETLLRDEAVLLNGLAGPEDAVWASVGPGGSDRLAGLRGKDGVDLVGIIEEPMTGLLQKSMQKKARTVDARLELRNAEAHRVEGWLAEDSFGAAVVPGFDGPLVCWSCRWADVDEGLARSADGGDAAAVVALQTKLRDSSLFVPIWRPKTVVAFRSGRGGVGGIRANGYALSAAWNAWEWHRE